MGGAFALALAGCDAVVGENDVGALIPRADSRLTLDGAMDPMYMASPEHALTKIIHGAPPEPADLSATWRAIYDEICIYVLVAVSDDFVVPSNLEGNWWEDDSIEVFVDGDNSAGAYYDRNDDAQLVFRHDVTTVVPGDSTGGVPKVDEMVVYAQPTALGYTMEIAIPWTSVNTEFREGMILGFDVHANDRDTRPSREDKLSWASPNDNAWTSPYLFGRVQLGVP